MQPQNDSTSESGSVWHSLEAGEERAQGHRALPLHSAHISGLSPTSAPGHLSLTQLSVPLLVLFWGSVI